MHWECHSGMKPQSYTLYGSNTGPKSLWNIDTKIGQSLNYGNFEGKSCQQLWASNHTHIFPYVEILNMQSISDML